MLQRATGTCGVIMCTNQEEDFLTCTFVGTRRDVFDDVYGHDQFPTFVGTRDIQENVGTSLQI